MTVSVAVNGRAAAHGIPEQTVLRIQKHLRQRGYVPSRPAVALRTGQRCTVGILHSKDPDGADLLAVRDTGIGIPADKLKMLFRKFTQIEETQDKVRKTKGCGLGLVICKEFVEAHGGRIWADSEYQKGTTFYFTLPPRRA